MIIGLIIINYIITVIDLFCIWNESLYFDILENIFITHGQDHPIFTDPYKYRNILTIAFLIPFVSLIFTLLALGRKD